MCASVHVRVRERDSRGVGDSGNCGPWSIASHLKLP